MNSNAPLSVRDTNELVKTIVGSYLGNKMYIQGELSNKKNSNGNLYFSLKDKDNVSSINCVQWKIPNDIFQNGDIVTVSGKITCYTKQGTYQITASSIDKSGVGDVSTKYEKLKEEFENKSYFSKKREFPEKIKNIGILTSTEGAALQDVLYVLNNNNFMGNVYIKNCLAQGNGCPKSVEQGIKYFSELNKSIPIDILLITRGGGGIEDLMGYSSEEVVKSIYECPIFTISAIGHEIDDMLSDFAADHRAPTPSIAGETIIKFQKKEYECIIKSSEKIRELEYLILSKLASYESKLDQYSRIHRSLNPSAIIDNQIEKIHMVQKRVRDKIYHNIHDSYHELDKLKIKNNAHDTKKLLKKGYTIITDENNNLIENMDVFKKKIRKKHDIKIIFEDGEINLKDLL